MKDGYKPDKPPAIDIHNSTWAIKEFIRTISAKDRSPVITNKFTDSIGLRFVIHFIGD